MRIERFQDSEEFFIRVGDFLVRHEAEHNLMLGFRGPLGRNLHAFGEHDPYLAAVVDGDDVVAAAARTPPHGLVVSRASNTAVNVLIDDLAADGVDLPAVGGPIAPAERFAHGWAAITGTRARLAIAERLYEATEVFPPSGVGGRMRICGETDRPTAVSWMDAFFAEAMPGSREAEADRFVSRRLAELDEGLVIWDDGGPVSLAGYAGATPNGIRIGPVYTPPELRRKGYAGALTAALTQQLLAGGRRSCFLFTNLANPTANSIYQRIGYRPLGDVSRWSFDRS